MNDAPAAMQLEGELTFATVPGFLQRSDALLGSGVLDMRRVTRADSAGLALLLELTRRQRSRGAELALVGAASGIVKLSQFFGLDEVLQFRDAAAADSTQGETTA